MSIFTLLLLLGATDTTTATPTNQAVAAIRSGLTPDGNDQLCQVICHTTTSPDANVANANADAISANAPTLNNKRKVVAAFDLTQATPASQKPKDGLVRKYFIIQMVEDGKLVFTLFLCALFTIYVHL